MSLLIITSCSFLTTQGVKEPIDPQWLNHKETLLNISKWYATGRFSAQGNEETWSGTFQWQNEKDLYMLSISAPLSGGSFLLKGDSNHVTLTYGDDKSVNGSNANSLLFQYTGLKLPVNELRYWLIGLPSPEIHADHIQLDESGRLKQLSQRQWSIDYKRYKDQNSYALPDKIFLENHEFDVRLSIQRWLIN